MPETDLPFPVIQEPQEEPQYEVDFNPAPHLGLTPDDFVPIIQRTVAQSLEPYIQQMQQMVRAPQAIPMPQAPKLEDVWYDDPGKAYEIIRANLRQEFAQEMQGQQIQQQAAKVWDTFSQNYPEFSDKVPFAQALFYQNPKKYQLVESTQGTEAAMAELATDLELAIGYAPDPDDDIIVETEEGSFTSPPPYQEPATPRGSTLLEIHKAQMAARRAAR